MNIASCFLKKLFCTLEKLSAVVISVLLSLNTFFIIHMKSLKSCNVHIDLLFAIQVPILLQNINVCYTEAHFSPQTIMRYIFVVLNGVGCIKTSGYREGLY